MQDSVTKHSSLPANYVSINDLREQWLKKQRPKREAVVEKEEKECEAGDEDEEGEFPRKYVTINDLREKWLKKQQKKEKKDDETRKENFGGNDELGLGFGVNPNLIEDDGDGNRGVMVDDWTVKKAEMKGKMTGSMRKKLWTERKRILPNNKKAQKRALQKGIVEEKGEVRGVVVENEAEMKQIGVSVMHIAVTQDVGKFRREKRFPGRWNVVQKEKGAQEEEDKKKVLPLAGTRNAVLEKRAQAMEKEKPFPVTGTRNTGLEKRAQEREVEDKGKWFTGTGTRNTVQEKRAQEVEEKPKRTEIGKNKQFPVTGTRNTVLEKRAEVDVDEEKEKGEWFPTTETRNTVQEKRAEEEDEKLKRSETGKKKRFPVTRTWNTVQQEKRAHEEEDEKEKMIREIEEKTKEVSLLEKQYQEVEQEMKEKKNELSLLEKRFNDIEKMKETQPSETVHNVSNNAEHGTYRRAIGYRRLEVSGRGRHGWGLGRGRGGGRSGNGHHSERGVVWVKKDEGLHKTN